MQAFEGAVHEPATQVRPPLQSVAVVQGQGPFVPPQALHVLSERQVLPSPQSAFVVHSFLVPGFVVGGEQSPDWQVSPFGQVASLEHAVVQPVDVQTPFGPQLALPVHDGCAGEVVGEQPYASHVKHPVLSQ